MMMNYLLGAIIGGVLGYFVLHRIIGCSTGTCPITANPYISIVYGIIFGVLIAGNNNPYYLLFYSKGYCLDFI